MASYETRLHRRNRSRPSEHVGVLEFDADELRNIALALGYHDAGARHMEDLADHLDVLNDRTPTPVASATDTTGAGA